MPTDAGLSPSSAAGMRVPPQHIQAAVRLRPLLPGERARGEDACLSLIPIKDMSTTALPSAQAAPIGGAEYGIRACVPLVTSGADGGVDGSVALRGPRLRPSAGKGVESSRARAALSPQRRVQDFTFDLCLGPAASQAAVFEALSVTDYCDDALDGRAATILCFGQTGSGKTFTLSGGTLAPSSSDSASSPSPVSGAHAEKETTGTAPSTVSSKPPRDRSTAKSTATTKAQRSKSSPSTTTTDTVKEVAPSPSEVITVAEDGLQYRAVAYLVQQLQARRAEANVASAIAKCSYVELYNEALYDLLQGTSGLRCRWSAASNAFFVEDCLLVECQTLEDFLLVLREGQGSRHRAGHLLNADSSRSHVLFTVYIETSYRDGAPTTYGKLTFVDLAGSERLSETGSDGEDTKSINKSLFALGHVIESLSRKAKTADSDDGTNKTKSAKKKKSEFVPFRSSVLTQLLMDSLGGQCRTLMVACVTPSSRFYEESLKTLRYAQRTRAIAATPVRRVDVQEAERFAVQKRLRVAEQENAVLRACLGLPARVHDGGEEPVPLTAQTVTDHLRHMLEAYAQSQQPRPVPVQTNGTAEASTPAARKPTSAPVQGRRLSRPTLRGGAAAHGSVELPPLRKPSRADSETAGPTSSAPLPLSLQPHNAIPDGEDGHHHDNHDTDGDAGPCDACCRPTDTSTLEVDMGAVDAEEEEDQFQEDAAYPEPPPQAPRAVVPMRGSRSESTAPVFSVLDLLDALPDSAQANPVPSRYGFRSASK